MVRYIDLTLPIEEGMPVWPGDSGPEFREVKSLEQDGYAVQSIRFSNHLGTHLDAPSHVVKGGMALERIPLETLIGKAVILDFTDNDPLLALGEGVLALQLHAGKPFWVEYKNIRIKEIE